MIFDLDRNRSGYESKKKKILVTPIRMVMLMGSLVLMTSSYVLSAEGHEVHHKLVTRSLHESEGQILDENPSPDLLKFNNTTISEPTADDTTVSIETNKINQNEEDIEKNNFTLKVQPLDYDEKNLSKNQCHNGPQKNIFFLKTHKAGSTTVQNVLLRYGEKNNATFALPNQPAAHVFNYNIKFNPSMVRPSPTGEYNILTNHLHFHEPGVRALMPKDTKKIAIVRHPIDLFESVMSYYVDDVRAFQRVPGKNIQERMKNFLDNPKKYYGFDSAHYEKFAKNAMMWDFGFDNDNDDDKAIDKWIEHLDKTFDLVLITDYFDESMVLLKEELCWETEDISYLKSNSRNTQDSQSVRNWLGEEYANKLLEWNKADWKLYRHFNETFTQKVEDFGVQRMKREVQKLQEANEVIREECLSDEQTTAYFHSVPLTKYRLKDKDNEECQNFIRSERQYLYKIKLQQESKMKQNSKHM